MNKYPASRSKRWRKLWQAVWILLLLAVVASSPFQRFKFVDSVENASLSLRFALRGVVETGPQDPRIVLVTVDDYTFSGHFAESDLEKDPWLKYFSGSWPLNRAVHGELLRRLLNAGARTVAFDFLFPGEGPGDDEFYEAIEEAGDRVTLAFAFVPVMSAGSVLQVRESLPYDDLLPEEDEDRILGFVNVLPDDDGVVRDTVLSSDASLWVLPFADDGAQRERLRRLSARMDSRLSLPARAAIQFDPLAAANIPEQRGLRIPINYAGPSGWFPTVRFIDLFLEDRRKAVEPLLKDALVMVVPWSGFFKDDHVTPFGNVFGGEIHAHVARNILLGNFLTRPALPMHLLWLAFFAVAVIGGVCWPRAAWLKVGSLLLLPVVCLALAHLAFLLGGWILPVVSAMVIILLGGGTALVFDFFIEQAEKKKLRSYFNRYVSREVAQVLLERGDGFAALNRGENRPVALLFSDIRGFTGMSEGRAPDELTGQLNEYFEAMVGAVFARRGSLNKYIGDAIFAVWGDLLSDGAGGDADNALRAALGMRQALSALNDSWAGRADRPPLRIGIGLHSGEAFVGNLGHPDRLEVAVMGEAVNLASRIEGATKDYGVDILVSGAFRELLPGKNFALVDRVKLSGVSAGVDLYFPVASGDAQAGAWADGWNRAMSLYRARRFEEAENAFASLTGSPPLLQNMYLARCRLFRQNPPPQDWNYTEERSTK